MKAMELVNILLMAVILFLAGVDGNSHGAPLSSCEKMGTIHVVFPSHVPYESPFGITFDKQQINPGDSVSILLSTKDEIPRIPKPPAIEGYFTGYLLMAFDESNEEAGPIGFFNNTNPQKGQLIDCYNRTKSAVTHVNPNLKPNITVDWVAPENFQGKVIFRCTFSESISSLWARVPSNTLFVGVDPETTPETTSETTPTTPTTTTPTTTTPTTTTPTTTTPTTTTTTTTVAPTTEAAAGSINGNWILATLMVISAFFL